MKVLLVGVGGVGGAIAAIAGRQDPDASWLEQMVLCDYDPQKAQAAAARLKDSRRFPTERLDARQPADVAALLKKYDIDLLLNACDPTFNECLFDTAYDCGCHYMDMAMTLSQPHAQAPYASCHVKLGDYQFARHEKWVRKDRLALVGAGVEPGMSDVFARYAEKHFFDRIDEIGVRDGNNLRVEGHDIAFGFSIWTTIEECLNPPVIWEKDRGWHTTTPFAEPEVFHLPAGIGPVEMVHVEHEEVLLIPRYIGKGLSRVTFKFGLGKEFIQALTYLQALNMDRKDLKVRVGDTDITPREFLARVAPDPAAIGHLMHGKTCAGTWVKGEKDGLERQIYLYQVADNQACMQTLRSQAVVAQTAFNPVIMLELLAKKIWSASGVCAPEAFDPDPFVSRMEAYGFPGGLMEMPSAYEQRIQAAAFRAPCTPPRND